MVDIEIRRLEAKHSAFPAVCMICGKPADGLKPVTIEEPNWWLSNRAPKWFDDNTFNAPFCAAHPDVEAEFKPYMLLGIVPLALFLVGYSATNDSARYFGLGLAALLAVAWAIFIPKDSFRATEHSKDVILVTGVSLQFVEAMKEIRQEREDTSLAELDRLDQPHRDTK